jgi:hypothetical protein
MPRDHEEPALTVIVGKLVGVVERPAPPAFSGFTTIAAHRSAASCGQRRTRLMLRWVDAAALELVDRLAKTLGVGGCPRLTPPDE